VETPDQLSLLAAAVAGEFNDYLTLILNHAAEGNLAGVEAAALRCREITRELLAFTCRYGTPPAPRVLSRVLREA
jgi:hypothetical protein